MSQTNTNATNAKQTNTKLDFAVYVKKRKAGYHHRQIMRISITNDDEETSETNTIPWQQNNKINEASPYIRTRLSKNDRTIKKLPGTCAVYYKKH